MGVNSGMVIVVGRGNGGTRVIAQTLRESGVYTGEPLNFADDLVPPDEMYAACRVVAKYVRYEGDYRWDFSRLFSGRIDPAFKKLLRSYLDSVLSSTAPWRGWKIPETTLCYPWVARMFPEAHFILWHRDPRDALLGFHMTDELAMFAIPRPYKEDVMEVRACSWLYQEQLMKETPLPKRFTTVRFEDFVRRQEPTLAVLEAFLGFPLVRVPVRQEEVETWRRLESSYPRYLLDALPRYGYRL